jgi:RimJ/RimL family protein N-acetyltransferase
MNGPMGVWWGMDGLRSRALHEREGRQRLETQNRHWVEFGLQTKDGVRIGTYALLHINPVHRIAEVGAGIGDPAYWGGGFGSDAMLLICEYGFAHLGLRRLWLTTARRNARARRQVEKCGWTYEACQRGVYFYEHGYHDTVWYGLHADEWPGYAVMAERLGLREKARERGLLVE